MKNMRLLTVAVMILGLAAAVQAACPDVVGTFSYLDGSCLAGRVSEAWCNGNPGETGNTENAMSWDGVALGSQWKVWGQQIDATGPVLISNTVDGGTGQMVYHTEYDGGQFWLSKDGGWGDGVNDLTGTITSYSVDATISYFAGQLVGATSNVALAGSFDNCNNGCLVDWAIANASLVWNPAMGTTMPDGYPAFLCGANLGELFSACCPTVHISCTVPTSAAPWGQVKALYR